MRLHHLTRRLAALLAGATLALAPAALGARNYMAGYFSVGEGCPGMENTSQIGGDGWNDLNAPGGVFGRCAVGVNSYATIDTGSYREWTYHAPGGTRIANVTNVAVASRHGNWGGRAWAISRFTDDTGGPWSWQDNGADFGGSPETGWIGTQTPPDGNGAYTWGIGLVGDVGYGAWPSGAAMAPDSWAYVGIGSATVNLWDYSGPTIASAILSHTGWKTTKPTSATVFMGAVSDNLGWTGISSSDVRVYNRQTAGWSTAVTGASNATQLVFNASTWADGQYDIYARVNPAGTGDLPSSSTLAGTLQMDTTPPSAPTSLAGAPAGWSSQASATLTPQGAADATSGLSTYRWETGPSATGPWTSQGTSATFTVSGPGQTWVRAFARDAAGLESAAASPAVSVSLDRTAGSIDQVAGGGSAWSPVALTLSPVNAQDALSGVAAIEWRRSGNGGTTWSALPDGAQAVVSDDGDWLYAARVRDGAGNTGAWVPTSARVDRTAPGAASVSGGSAAWTRAGQVDLAAGGASDATSGVDHYLMRCSTDGGPLAAPVTTASLALAAEGDHAAIAAAVDAAGNVGPWSSPADAGAQARIDRTAPELTLSAPAGWQSAASVSATATASDARSGLHDVLTETSSDGASWVDAQAGPVRTVSQEGATHVRAQATDQAGNRAEQTALILIDRTPPEASALSVGELTPSGARVRWTATDATSGVAGQALQVNAATDGSASGAWSTLADPAPDERQALVDHHLLAEGRHLLRLVVSDQAGNARTLEAPEALLTVDRSGPQVSASLRGEDRDAAGVRLALSDELSGLGPEVVIEANAAADGGTGGAWVELLRAAQAPSLDLDVPTGALAEGRHAWRVVAADALGSSTVQAGPGTLLVDRTAPVDTDATLVPRADASARLTFTLADPGSGIAAEQTAVQASEAADGQGPWVALDTAGRGAGAQELVLDPGLLADGRHPLRVHLVDAHGNAADRPLGVSLVSEAQAPAIGAVEWAQGQPTRAHVRFALADRPDVAVGLDPAGVSVAVNAAVGAPTGAWHVLATPPGLEGTVEADLDLDGLADGTHALRVRAQDRYGRQAEVVAQVAVDATDPGQVVVSGPEGVVRDLPAVFGASAPEPGAALEWEATGPGLADATGSGPSFAVAGEESGTFSVRVRARDGAGRSGSWTERGFVRDRQGPVVSGAGAVQASPTAWRVSWTSTDQGAGTDAAASQVWAETSPGTWAAAGSPRAGEGAQEALIPIPAGVSDGQVSLQIRVADRLGNEGQLTLAGVATDRTAPEVSVSAAAAVPGQRLALTVAAEDGGSGLDPAAEVEVQEPAGAWRLLGRAPLGAGVQSVVVDASTVASGSARLRVRVRDAVGNAAVALAPEVSVSREAPAVGALTQTWSSPTTASLGFDLTDLGGGIAGATTIEIQVGSEWRLLDSRPRRAGHQELGLDFGSLGLGDGRYRLRITAQDAQGQTRAALMAALLVTQPPQVSAQVSEGAGAPVLVRSEEPRERKESTNK